MISTTHVSPQTSASGARATADLREARSGARARPVLVATDGDTSSQSATLLARLLAERNGAPLRVVTVIEPIIVFAGSTGLSPMPVVVSESVEPRRVQSVRDALAQGWPEKTAYELEPRFGPLVHEIAAAASESGAGSVLVGAAPRIRGARSIAGVLASQLIRKVHAPVVSVAPGLDHLPRQIVVGVDFSVESLRAAREAIRMLEPGGTLTLAHVRPIVRPGSDGDLRAGDLDVEQASRKLTELRSHLWPLTPGESTVNVQVLTGVAQDQLLDLVVSLRADLVAVGTHGPGILERFFVGSVAANLLHSSPCSVLVAPTPGILERLELDLDAKGATASTDESSWQGLLDQFTVRNAERTVRVEVHDMEVGAQVQASGYVLRGVSFEPSTRTVEIMLGSAADSLVHLTRAIQQVTAIGITRADDGSDNAMQVRTGGGDTMLLFER